MSVAVAVEASASPAAAGLTNREVRILPVRCLALRTRQGRANKTTVYWTVLVSCSSCHRFLFCGRVDVDSFDGFDRNGFRCSNFGGDGSLDELIDARNVVMREIQALTRYDAAARGLATALTFGTRTPASFLRRAGTRACLYSWSASHVVQRVCLTWSSIIATTA
jgi:hypothetical protein